MSKRDTEAAAAQVPQIKDTTVIIKKKEPYPSWLGGALVVLRRSGQDRVLTAVHRTSRRRSDHRSLDNAVRTISGHTSPRLTAHPLSPTLGSNQPSRPDESAFTGIGRQAHDRLDPEDGAHGGRARVV